MNTFLVGIIKAPVFAIVIGLVGCSKGCRSNATPPASAS